MKRSAFLFLLFLLLIGLVYSPVLYFNYLFHDDATLWVKLKDYGFRHYYYYKSMSECRYGLAWLLNLENLFVHKVSDVKSLRFLGILILSGNAFFLFRHMRRLPFSELQAFLVISATFFLPGFADIICNGSYSCIFALCIFISSWSFYRTNAGKGMLMGTLSLLLAITIYPPASMFYWSLTGLRLLFVKDTNNTRTVVTGSASLLLYGMLVFLMHYFFSHKIRSSLYNPYAVSHDWHGKLHWFFHEPLNNALNLWDIFPKTSTSDFVLGFMALTALLVIKRKGFTLNSLSRLGLFIFIFFLTFLPNLAAKENAAFYRCLIPLTSLIWFVVVWAILQWMDLVPQKFSPLFTTGLLSVIVLLAGIQTYRNVLVYRVLPSYVEYNAYKSMAQEIRLHKIDAIHILLPYHNSNERYDEFVVVSTHYMFDIYHLIHSALQETGGQGAALPLVYISFPGNDTLYRFDEIYFKKLSNGKWVFKILNRDGQFHEYDHSGRNTLDRGLTTLIVPQYTFPKKQSWYTLDINAMFNPSHYNELIGKINKQFGDTTAIEINPEFARAYVGLENTYYNLGLAYYKQGKLGLAVLNYNKALELNPKDIEAYSDQAVIFYKLREYDKAWDDVRRMQDLGSSVNPQLINALKGAGDH